MGLAGVLLRFNLVDIQGCTPHYESTSSPLGELYNSHVASCLKSESLYILTTFHGTTVQLIEKGLAVGEGVSGGSEYTGLTGIAHAYLHIHETLCRQEQLPQILQGLAAASNSLLSKATEMVDVARASPQVLDTACEAPIHVVYSHWKATNLSCVPPISRNLLQC